MLVKFLGMSMKAYAGIDGNGGNVKMSPGDTVEVSEQVGKILLTRYGKNFQLVLKEKVKNTEHSPKADKYVRKSDSTKTK